MSEYVVGAKNCASTWLALAYQSVIGASGLSEVACGKTDGLKWRIAELVC